MCLPRIGLGSPTISFLTVPVSQEVIARLNEIFTARKITFGSKVGGTGGGQGGAASRGAVWPAGQRLHGALLPAHALGSVPAAGPAPCCPVSVGHLSTSTCLVLPPPTASRLRLTASLPRLTASLPRLTASLPRLLQSKKISLET